MKHSTRYYAGLDLHKRTIAYCVRRDDGTIMDEGSFASTRPALRAWVSGWQWPCRAGMEATMFTGWVYDSLLEQGVDARVGHPLMMRAISAGKRKNDKLDARTLANLLRCDLFPECYMAPENLRELRRVLRYRNLLVREATRLKNKASGLLMEVGATYSKPRLHGKQYFATLMDNLEDVPSSLIQLLRFNHDVLHTFESQQRWLLGQLEHHPDLAERVQRLQTIPGVGVVTALTWALEVGDPYRFARVKAAVSYCGLCSAQAESAGIAKRGPLSKQRNKFLQSTLIEAAKLAPRWNPPLQALYHREKERGANHNKATLAVARKLVAYLLCVDKTQEDFECTTAA